MLNADPQRRVYVRRINVAGNDRTRDEVVRREFRQLESAWYDGDRIKLSRDRVDRLGFFKEVNVETDEVPNSADQVDLTVKVVEKPTGNLLVGAGYSSSDKLSFTASIKQENVFGSGNYLGIELNTSQSNRNLVLSTVDPYFTVDGISRAIDVFYRTSSPINSRGEEYKLVTPGRGDPLRRAVLRLRHRVLRRRLRADAHLRRRHQQELQGLPRALRRQQHARCR